MYRFAARRQLVNDTHLQIAIYGHRESARDRSGGHDKDMRWTRILVPQFGALRHTKAVLLVYDAESEIGKLHCVFYQRVCANEDIDISAEQLLVDRLALFGGSRASQQGNFEFWILNFEFISSKHFTNTLIVLVGENLGGCHNAGLITVVYCE